MTLNAPIILILVVSSIAVVATLTAVYLQKHDPDYLRKHGDDSKD